MYEAFEPREGGRTWKFQSVPELARKIDGKGADIIKVEPGTGPRRTVLIGHPSGGAWSVATQVRIPIEALNEWQEEVMRRVEEDGDVTPEVKRRVDNGHMAQFAKRIEERDKRKRKR